MDFLRKGRCVAATGLTDPRSVALPGTRHPLLGSHARIATATPALRIRTDATRAASADLLFPAAIGLSAFLLFTLELVAGQLVLPVFGGTPGVWATALCFFTAVLFLGYLYAHLVATRLDPVKGGTLHLLVAVGALVSLILAPPDNSSLRRPGVPEALNVLVALLVIAGPAAFLLASTTPLLSAWYAKQRQNPWGLYAASNAASFLALVANPFVVAPTIGLSAERSAVALGILVFVAILFAIVVAIQRAQRTVIEDGLGRPNPGNHHDGPATIDSDALSDNSPPTLRRQAIWLFAAFAPAGLLSATTNFITTDLVSAPLLWVGPLSIYLLSLVIVFSAHGRRFVRFAQILVPAAAALLWLPWIAPATWPLAATLMIEFGAFFVLAVAIHGRLAADRPRPTHVTRFYLVLSAGGMLATAFVSLLAPLVFNGIYEYPILIVAGLAALAVLPDENATPISTKPLDLVRGAATRLAPYVVASTGLVLVITGGSVDRLAAVLGLFVVGGYAIAIAIWPAVLPVSTAMAIVLASLASPSPNLLQTRTFFGVLRVATDGTTISEYSGTTLHGTQYLGPRRSEPTIYYVRSGPIGEIFRDLDARAARASIGVVGLGIGTTIVYARPADSFTFYEIDQAVVDIANDPYFFSNLRSSPSPPRIVVGDARLSLAAEPIGQFDLLILDAFSSDSIPVHLLTREAMATYARTLHPGGLILFHLSNRYYELDPAVVATARSVGFAALAQHDENTGDPAAGSIWALAGTAGAVTRFAASGWVDPGPGPVLTDDFSDLLSSLRLRAP
jgi:hypothetical protein